MKKNQRLIPNQNNIKADIQRAKVIKKSLWLQNTVIKLGILWVGKYYR